MGGEGHMLDMIRRLKDGKEASAYAGNGEMTN